MVKQYHDKLNNYHITVRAIKKWRGVVFRDTVTNPDHTVGEHGHINKIFINKI
jgi:hypothetical protein